MAKTAAGKTRQSLQIGVAAIDITPPVGATLVGYAERTSNGVGHRLRAEALFCKGDGGAWVLLTGDTIGYDGAYAKIVRDKVARATGLKPDAIMLSGTHTHSGPSVIRFGPDTGPNPRVPIDVKYRDDLQERLSEVAAAAKKAARPGCFEIAWAEAPDLGHNRRIRLAHGKWANEWEDDFGKHQGYFDPTIMLIGVRHTGKETRQALLVNYGVHPVVLGPQSLKISADYVGYMKDTLEATGEAQTVLFALAGAGNINPRTCIKAGAEYPRKMGEKVATVVSQAARKLSPVAGDRVAVHSQPWVFARTRDEMKGPGKKGGKVETEIQTLRAGDLVLLSIPGELFSEFNQIFREASPFPHTALVTLANAYIGYLPTDAAMAEGAYEANMCPAESVEPMMLQHVQKTLQAVAD